MFQICQKVRGGLSMGCLLTAVPPPTFLRRISLIDECFMAIFLAISMGKL